MHTGESYLDFCICNKCLGKHCKVVYSAKVINNNLKPCMLVIIVILPYLYKVSFIMILEISKKKGIKTLMSLRFFKSWIPGTQTLLKNWVFFYKSGSSFKNKTVSMKYKICLFYELSKETLCILKEP